MNIVKQETGLKKYSNYQEHINAILENIILLDSPEDKKLVIDKYYELLHSKEKLPDFSDLQEYILYHNEDMFWEAANITFANEYDGPDLFKDEYDVDSTIDDISWHYMEWMGYYHYDIVARLEHILREERLSVAFTVNDEIFESEKYYDPWLYGDVTFLMSSCQNELFEGFIDDGCASYGSYLIYYGSYEEGGKSC